MHCGVRLHGQNACFVIFWNIAPQHYWVMMNLFKFLISTIFSILYALLLQKHIQSHIPNNYKVINKNKMSCNTLCLGKVKLKIKWPGRLEKTQI
jgi:hypothetical protein